MKKKERLNHKQDFTLLLQSFVHGLREKISTQDGQWKIKGFIDTAKNVFTISDDTKIVSKILEIHLFPLIYDFAKSNGFRVVLPDHQNYYPDMTFESLKNDNVRFAVDIKTSYRLPNNDSYISGFTLGSHGTYFKDRNSNKNIQYPYATYLGHFCIGIIYTRAFVSGTDSYPIYEVAELMSDNDEKQKLDFRPIEIDELNSIVSVFSDFTFFACEKWQIASDKHGSGNTANIGSITNIQDLLTCNGMFSKLG